MYSKVPIKACKGVMFQAYLKWCFFMQILPHANNNANGFEMSHFTAGHMAFMYTQQ